MKKSIWGIAVFVGILLVVLLLYPASVRNEPKPTKLDDLALYEYVTGNGTKHLSVSKAVTKLTYAKKDGSDPIYYYIVKTTYCEAAPKNVTGPHTDAFRAVFDPDDACSIKKTWIQDQPGCFYILPERSFLCWTATPDTSYILEYDPKAVSDAEILRMAQSTAPLPPALARE